MNKCVYPHLLCQLHIGIKSIESKSDNCILLHVLSKCVSGDGEGDILGG